MKCCSLLRHSWAWSACSLVLCVLLSSCGRPVARPLRIGVNPWPGHAFLLLAEDQGFYAAEGVEVRVVEYSSLADLRRAFELGQIDAMGVTAVEVLQAYDQSGRVGQAFLVTDFSTGADMIVAHGPVHDVAGLRGRRVAVEPGSLNVYVLARALERAGLTLDDVTIVATNQSEIPAAMAAGSVDAAVTYPPYAQLLLEAAGGGPSEPMRVLFTTAAIPDELPSLLVMDRDTLAARPADAAGVVQAWARAVAYAAAHRDDAYAVMAARQRMSTADFAAALDLGTRVVSLREQPDLLQPGGVVDRAFGRTAAYLLKVNQIRQISATGTFVAGPAAARSGR